jgi:hypothetical protein
MVEYLGTKRGCSYTGKRQEIHWICLAHIEADRLLLIIGLLACKSMPQGYP